MMTLERAAELVAALRNRQTDDTAHMDLLNHFIEFFGLEGEQILQFATMCGCLFIYDAEAVQ